MIPLRRIRSMCTDLFGYSVSEATIVGARERCASNLERFMKVTGERLGKEQNSLQRFALTSLLVSSKNRECLKPCEKR